MNIETCTLVGHYQRNGMFCTWMICYDSRRCDFIAFTTNDEESECNNSKDRRGERRFPTREEAIHYLQGVLKDVDPVY